MSTELKDGFSLFDKKGDGKIGAKDVGTVGAAPSFSLSCFSRLFGGGFPASLLLLPRLLTLRALGALTVHTDNRPTALPSPLKGSPVARPQPNRGEGQRRALRARRRRGPPPSQHTQHTHTHTHTTPPPPPPPPYPYAVTATCHCHCPVPPLPRDLPHGPTKRSAFSISRRLNPLAFSPTRRARDVPLPLDHAGADHIRGVYADLQRLQR